MVEDWGDFAEVAPFRRVGMDGESIDDTIFDYEREEG